MNRRTLPAASSVAAFSLLAGCGSDPVDPCVARQEGYLCEVAGTGALGFNGDGLPALESDLYAPTKASRGPDGRVWIMDFQNQMLRVIDEEGALVPVAGFGFHGYAEEGRVALQTPLGNPIDFDFLPSGEPVFVSAHDPRVLVVRNDGTIGALAGTASQGNEGDGGAANDATFVELLGLAVGPDGGMYVVDDEADRVRVVRDNVVSAFAGTGEEGYAGDGGSALDAKLSTPTAIAVAPDGSVVIADRRNHVVRRVAPDGVIETIAGTGAAGFNGDDQPARDAMLAEPDGLAYADDGTLYVADQKNFRVRAIDPDGTIRTVAGTGVRGHEGADGPAETADLAVPARLSWSPGELFIADQGNSCIRVLYLEGAEAAE